MANQATLIHLVASNRFSGAERYALDICRHFSGCGIDVLAYTRDAKAVDNMFERCGIPLRHAPLQGFFDPASISILAADLKTAAEKTVVHVHRFRDAFTALAARKLASRKDIRIVMTRHIVRRGRDSWLYRRMYRNIDALIFVSETARERFLSTWRNRRLPFDESKITVLHNSLNLPLSEPVPEPEKGPVIAMFLGPIQPGKGIETLIDALTVLKGARTRLWMIGSGHPDYLDKLRLRAEARGVMQLIDWKKHSEDPHALIRESHFGVLPSTAQEAFGMPNIEFMFNGRPQVSTANGAQLEYLRDGENALIVPAASPQQLGEALLRLATDPELRKRLGRNAYESFRDHLAWPAFVSGLAGIYSFT